VIRARWPDRVGGEDGGAAVAAPVFARLCIGNTYSEVRPRADASQRERRNVHLWTVFVEPSGPCPPVARVEFWLWTRGSHVVLTRPPWAVTRKGWGTFDVRIRVTFRDPRIPPYETEHELQFVRGGARGLSEVELPQGVGVDAGGAAAAERGAAARRR
jgi:hypothetical protein